MMSKLFKVMGWFACFLIATYSLSETFRHIRMLTLGGETQAVFGLIAWGAMLFLSFLVLGYNSYMNSLREGTVCRKIWFYEKFNSVRFKENKYPCL